MKRSWMSLPPLLAVFLLAAPALALADKVVQPKPGAAGQWRLIGQTHANHTADHDKILVKGPYDSFRKLKFKVTDAPLEIHYMLVTYDDGGAPQRVDVRQKIPQGGESRAIDLKGVAKRKLRTVEFWYESKGFLTGKADVTLFGQK